MHDTSFQWSAYDTKSLEECMPSLVRSVFDSIVFVARTCSHVVHDHESDSDSCLAVFGHPEAHVTNVVLLIVAWDLIWEDMYSTHTIFNSTPSHTHVAVIQAQLLC